MCPNSEEHLQQGFVNIVRKGVNKIVKTKQGFVVETDFTKLSAKDKMIKILTEGASDLHLHTHASDGADSPPDLLKKLMKRKIKSFAITDHDTFKGIKDIEVVLNKLMQMRVKNLPRMIPGVELSLTFEQQEIHLLAYFPDGVWTDMEAFLERTNELRMKRNEEMCKRLADLGMAVSLEDLHSQCGDVIGRVHFASIMVQKGYASDINSAFDRYLAVGKPAYVDRFRPSVPEAVKIIKAAGGIPVIAHPAIYGWIKDVSDTSLLKKKLASLVKAGVEGVEVIHGETSLEQSREISRLAKEFSLLRTIGSDYHGANKSGVNLIDPKVDYSDYLIN